MAVIFFRFCIVALRLGHIDQAHMRTRTLPKAALSYVFIITTLVPLQADAPDPAEVRSIAKEAYVYGFPIVDNLRVQHSYFTDRSSPEYKAPYNQLVNIPRVFTPQDKAVQTPNSDTPYSWVGLDLRGEPVVFSIPEIGDGRYWSVQLIDLYTHNFAYLGTRATGNGGGNFLIAGPGWQGETPDGIDKVIRCETELALALFRTQLFNPGDLDNVKAIQDQYKVQTLSAFLGQPAAAAPPAIEFPKPLTPEEQRTSLDFFRMLNFGLQFSPVDPSEKELRERFAKIGIGPGQEFDPAALTPETREALQAGMVDGWEEFAAVKKRVEAGELTSGDLFGTRAYLDGNHAYRMTAAVLGIYGNSKEEAMYPAYYVDSQGQPLNGANRYTLRFAPGQLPPVGAFWSLTMYEQPASLLVENPIDRYLLNSTMMESFRRDEDGGLTLYIQHESPGAELESNWLPAPAGPFSLIMRLYQPQTEALDGRWPPPPVTKL
jgi:hypothetical protein